MSSKRRRLRRAAQPAAPTLTATCTERAGARSLRWGSCGRAGPAPRPRAKNAPDPDGGNADLACRFDSPKGQKKLLEMRLRAPKITIFAKFRAHPSQPRAKTVARIIFRTSLERGPRLSLQRRLRGPEIAIRVMTAEHDNLAEVGLLRAMSDHLINRDNVAFARYPK
eukprot:gene18093-biopygen17377